MVCQYSKHLYTIDIPYKLLKERKKDKKYLTELAIDICIPDISGNAHANHRPLGQRVLHTALSVASARLEFCARVPANFLQTRLSTRTVSINTTFWLRDWD